jgi:hypothetical protein
VAARPFFFFFSKMGLGEEKKRVGPAWQWEEEKTLRLGDGLLFLVGKGTVFIWAV